jgi:hypothetical protein
VLLLPAPLRRVAMISIYIYPPRRRREKSNK